jgi:hypothetical protein
MANQVSPTLLVCPDPYCTKPELTSAFVLANIEPAHSFYSELYTRRLNEHLIKIDPLMSWCSAQGCDGVIPRNPRSCLPYVQCTRANPYDNARICGNRQCGHCGLDPHPFRSCASAQNSWNSKYIGKYNLKKCPNCNVQIEKDGGCSHMTCTICSHQFCWHCKAEWRAHNKLWNDKICGVVQFFDRGPYCRLMIYPTAVVVPPVALVVGSVAVGLVVTVGIPAAIIASPFFLVKKMIKMHKQNMEKLRRQRWLHETMAQNNSDRTGPSRYNYYPDDRYAIQRGVGITIVGGRNNNGTEELMANVRQTFPGRTLWTGLSSTFVAYQRFAFNVAFRKPEDLQLASFDWAPAPSLDRHVEVGEAPQPNRFDMEGAEAKPHFVYIWNIDDDATGVEEAAEKVGLRNGWRALDPNIGNGESPPVPFRVMNLATEILALLPAEARTYLGILPDARTAVALTAISDSLLFALIVVHVTEMMGHISQDCANRKVIALVQSPNPELMIN